MKHSTLSSEREEVKWKCQVLIENTNSIINLIETERKFLENRIDKFVNTIDNMRKHWFTGLAIITTIMLAFIFEKDLDGWYYLGIIIPALTAFVIFFITNLKIDKFDRVYLDIGDFYYNLMRIELHPLKSLITMYALEGSITIQKINILTDYIRMHGSAIGFLLEKYMDEKLELHEFDKKKYVEDYEFTKNNMNVIKNENYSTGTETIEKFIGLYESMK